MTPRQLFIWIIALALTACSNQTTEKKQSETFFIPDSPSTTVLWDSGRSEVKCPKGNTDSIIQIVYGLPTQKTIEKHRRGEVELGGCDEDSLSPHWYCKIHKVKF